MGKTLAEIIDYQVAGRTDLLKVLNELSARDMVEPSAIVKWSVKDTLGHISTWDEFYTEAIRSWREKRPLESDYDDLDEFNARHVKRKAQLGLDEVLQQFSHTRAVLMEEVRSLKDSDLNSPIVLPWPEHDTVGKVLELQMEHDAEHAEDIRRWLASR